MKDTNNFVFDEDCDFHLYDIFLFFLDAKHLISAGD